MVKTAPSHGAISGSNPLGVTSIQEHLIGALFLCVQIGEDRKLKRKQIALVNIFWTQYLNFLVRHCVILCTLWVLNNLRNKRVSLR